MKTFRHHLFCFALLSISVLLNANPPSPNPPGIIERENVPQFVFLGFDDNTRAEGINWILDFIDTLRNPEGSGNIYTFDGTKPSVSFLSISSVIEARPSVAQAHRRAYDLGHEIGNHSHNHISYGDSLPTASYQTWLAEISSFTQTVSSLLDIPSEEIYGFRAPYLHFSDTTFKVLSDLGYLYDCSVQEGFQRAQDGTDFLWPYTMEEGSPGWNDVWVRWDSRRTPISSHPDLWQLPNHTFMIPLTDEECLEYGIEPGLLQRMSTNTSVFNNDRISGSDYSLWHTYRLSANEVLGILKYNLDKRLEGNRAPFFFSAHSQYYTEEYAKDIPNATLEEMREAVEQFILYALSIPEVRMVSGRHVINWCKQPVPLYDTPQLYTLTVNDGSGSGEYEAGSAVTITANPAPSGQAFSQWSGDISDVENIYGSVTVVTVPDSNITISATYIDILPDDTSNTGNIIANINWNTHHDNYGSDTDTGYGLNGLDTITIDYNLVPRPSSTQRPWVALTAELRNNLSGLHRIIITYRSTTDLYMTLDQNIPYETIPSHRALLTGSSEWRTDTLILSNGRFELPPWADPETELNLSETRKISLWPAVTDYSEQNEGCFEISQIVLFGVEWDFNSILVSATTRTQPGSFSLRATPQALSLNVPKSGSYTISIHSLDGRLISRLPDQRLVQGGNSINWNITSPGAQLFIITVTGEGVSQSRKISFVK
ncbi:chitin deacetylase [Chitinispirillum alkaliphilum]|nr:chitin deacetylase [Chitinispirillum alkaliphilum]